MSHGGEHHSRACSCMIEQQGDTRRIESEKDTVENEHKV